MRKSMSQAVGVVALVVGLSTGCSDNDGPLRLPTSPTPVTTTRPTTTTTSTWPVKPVDQRFDDAFWRELVYNESSRGTLQYSRSRVMVDPGRLNVYVDVSQWPAELPQAEWLPWIERQWPGWIRTMTGQTWTGRLESGPARSVAGGGAAGWIVIRWEGQLATGGLACGGAPVGEWPDRGYIALQRARSGCGSWSRYMTTTLPHELGHALGFSHVTEPWAVMNGRTGNAPPFSAREQYHMQLAYEVGRGRAYCGWPYSAGC